MPPRTEAGKILRPTDWLADEHAQRDAERVAAAKPRTIRYHNPHHARGARQMAILGHALGAATGTDGED